MYIAADIPTTALYGYDYLLTLPQEIMLVWGKKVSLATGAYFLGRFSLGVSLTFNYALNNWNITSIKVLSYISIMSVFY